MSRSILPNSNQEYGNLEYWQERYSTIKSTKSNDASETSDSVETFEWFKSFADLKEILLQMIPCTNSAILQLGCGNSSLSEDMYVHGYQNITNVDYSENVIMNMAKRCHNYSKMKWICADIFKLTMHFAPESFDVALDKGTLDALLTIKHDPWNPPKELLDQMHAYISQISQVLKPGGVFLHITFAQPHFRSRFLETQDFHVSIHKLGKDDSSFEYYVYRCVKKE